MKKTKKDSRLSHKSETVRTLSGRDLTTASGGCFSAGMAGAGCGDTCGGGAGQVSNSHGNQYTCPGSASFTDW